MVVNLHYQLLRKRNYHQDLVYLVFIYMFFWKCFTQIYGAFCGNVVLVPLVGQNGLSLPYHYVIYNPIFNCCSLNFLRINSRLARGKVGIIQCIEVGRIIIFRVGIIWGAAEFSQM